MSDLEIATLRWQYEVAMAIGTSLETHTMLAPTLSVLLRVLACDAAAVYFDCRPGQPYTPECAMPTLAADNPACWAVQQLLQEAHSGAGHRPTLAQIRDRLPRQRWDAERGYQYIWELPEIGLLALVKGQQPLTDETVRSLRPLLKKLAAASAACLQNEELARTHGQTEMDRNMLRTLIENTPIIVFMLDREGVFTLSEGHGLRAVGRGAGEAVGRSIFDVYAQQPHILEAVRAALAGEARSITTEIGGISFDARYEPVRDMSGRVSGVVGVAHDITERKRAVETLQAVLDTVGEGIVTIDENGAIVMMNPEAERIFGHALPDILHQPIARLMPESYRQAHTKGMQRYLSTGISHVLDQRLELEGLRQDGSTFPLELQIAASRSGGARFFTASVRDITRRKELDRMRDEFVSTVSHELRTPLASVMGWTETLQSERPGLLNPKQQHMLDIIYRSSQRLNTLIEEILTVSRIQKGVLQLEQALFYPSMRLRHVIDMVETTATAREQRIEVEDRWPQNLALVGDGSRIEQVITNLVGNALKFSHPGGRVRVRSWLDQNRWHLEVEDEGIGIHEEELPLLFDRFYRASTAREAQIQGTGIGLYVCKAIVEGHGGQIGLSSRQGEGTRVDLWIPATADG